MAEEVKEVTQEVPEVKEDLTKRVSQVQLDKPEEKFNVTDIDRIEDPNAKAYAEKAYKSFEKGFQEKYRALADDRKAWEAKKAESDQWTADKVQTLLNDPSFVQAAQSVTVNNDDSSMLSDTEKKRIGDAERTANMVLQQNAQLLKQQQDETNKTKYANYDAQAVDILTADLIQGKVQATREDIWKVRDYNDAVKRAYQLGLEDKNVNNVEKINSMSATGKVVVGDNSVPAIEKDETNKNYFQRLALRRLQQSQESGQVRK